MKCNTVRTKLAGYLDDALTGTTSADERVQIGEHLNGCTVCRAELETFRKPKFFSTTFCARSPFPPLAEFFLRSWFSFSCCN
jgi:predicted anti-sigma-YlaC factor YlaD